MRLIKKKKLINKSDTLTEVQLAATVTADFFFFFILKIFNNGTNRYDNWSDSNYCVGHVVTEIFDHAFYKFQTFSLCLMFK